MTRRLRIASTALGAFLVPACASYEPSNVTHSATAPRDGRQALANRPILTPVNKANRPSDNFATERPEPTSTVAQGKPAVPEPTAKPEPTAPTPKPETPPVVLAPIEHRTEETPKPAPTVAPQGPTLPSRFTSRDEAAKIPPAPEPARDAEGVARAPWPILKGTLPLVDPDKPEPTDSKLILPPPSELIKPVEKSDDVPPVLAPVPAIAPPKATPPTLPPGVIGSSLHQTHASPVTGAAATELILPAEPKLPEPEILVGRSKLLPESGESPLIRAVRAFQQNKPEEAVEHLKVFGPETQQVCLSLMPALVRLSDGKLGQMKPEEMDLLLDQLTRAPNILRPRASLKANNVKLCREVLNFGHVEPFAERHTYRPGDIIYLYMELANFSCVPEPKGGYAITMTSSLEMKDASGAVVWRADPKEVPDRVSSPPQDYYRNFRLCVPTVSPGTYTLTVKTTDRPTGREVVKTIELLVGSK